MKENYHYRLMDICKQYSLNINHTFVEYCSMVHITEPDAIRVIWENSQEGEAILLTEKQVIKLVSNIPM